MSMPFEPSAEARVAARQYRNLHEALIAEGFTTAEALTLLGHVIAASISLAAPEK